LLLLNRAMRNRPEDVRIETCVAGQLLCIDLIALSITVRYGSQFADVGHDDFVLEFLQLLADPDRMRSCLHRNTCVRKILEPLLDRLRRGPETAPIDYVTVLVESTVMAPDIAKVDTNRQLGLGLPAWNFRDEVPRRLLHGKQSLPSGGPAHPISRYRSVELMSN
jgi:hypothetical protein